jgi:hypothetical protein
MAKPKLLIVDDLRNAVRDVPQNAEAHYWLGRVIFELGDPVASERERRSGECTRLLTVLPELLN